MPAPPPAEPDRTLSHDPELDALPTRPQDPDPGTASGDALPPGVREFVAQLDRLMSPSGPDTPPAAAAPPPARAGRYELLGEIARGGMGVVYRARDTGLDRNVAVKTLRDNYSSSSLTARRFLGEARITGQLQHPGIPPVHEVGELPDGRPFLAMKLIKGRTLAELLADGSPGRGSLVAAFEQICQAVAYAHDHSVIHRDLKPQNVMVGAFGEVQVMDWGLAKFRTDARAETAGVATASTFHDPRGEADTDLRTRTGSFLGTPAYMSPEQAIGAVDQIDERTDVFGLGGILCAVLTGQPPFVGPSAESARQLAARGELGPAFARLDGCGAEPDLVTLCKRCLDPDPAARPRDAGEVADAVHAFRAEAEERARRAELDRVRAEGERTKAELRAAEERKRRRLQFALAGLLLSAVALAIGFVLVSRERDQKELARQVAVTRELEAVSARDAEATARRQTRQALNTMTDGVVGRLFAKQVRHGEDEKEFLRTVLRLYEEFASTGGDITVARESRADGLFRVGSVRHNLGEQAEAESAYRDSIDEFGKLAADFPVTPDYREALARAHKYRGYLLNGTGRYRDAEVDYQAARELFSKLVADLPSNPKYRAELARTLAGLGQIQSKTERLKDAEVNYRDAQALLARPASELQVSAYEHETLAWIQNSLGSLLVKTRRWQEAEACYRDAVMTFARLATEYPAAPEHRDNLARAHGSLGRLLDTIGETEKAKAAYRDAIAVFVSLAAEFPAVAEYRAGLAQTYGSLGRLLITKRPKDNEAASRAVKDSEAAYRDALVLVTRLTADFPKSLEFRDIQARLKLEFGELLAVTRRPTDAEIAYREALAGFERLAAELPVAPEHRDHLVRARTNLGHLLRAEVHLDEPDALLAAGVGGVPGHLLRVEVRWGEAGSNYRAAIAVSSRLATDFPTPERRAALARAYQGLVRLLRLRGRTNEAGVVSRKAHSDFAGLTETLLGLGHHVRAAEAAEELARLDFDPPTDRYDAARFLARCVPLAANDPALVAAKRGEITESYGSKSVALLRQALAKGMKDATQKVKDKDFDPIRGRADFAVLLRELAKGPPPTS